MLPSLASGDQAGRESSAETHHQRGWESLSGTLPRFHNRARRDSLNPRPFDMTMRSTAAEASPSISHVDQGSPYPAGASVLLDRDGVVNFQRTGRYVHSWPDFEFLPRALDAFRALAHAGVSTYVATNQGGVGRGHLTAGALADVHDRMAEAIRDAGGRLDAIAHCPHAPDDGCRCRKPRPGMLFGLASRFGIDLSASFFIGDNVTDLEAGVAAGCRTILVGTGEGVRSAGRLGINEPFTGFTGLEPPPIGGLVGVAGDILDAVHAAIARRAAG